MVRGHTRLPLIAKMEKPQAVDRAEDIIKAADCVMVARGTMASSWRSSRDRSSRRSSCAWPAGWPGQRSLPPRCSTRWSASRPTRAEVADVANAILDGTDAVMFSQETAIGAYPVEAIAMMAAIAEQTETTAPYERWNATRVRPSMPTLATRWPTRCAVAARELLLDALIVPTLSGRSARLVSAHRPIVPIYALSPGRETVLPLRADVGRTGCVDAPPRDDRGADRRRRPAGGRVGLVQAWQSRRRRCGSAGGRTGHDEPRADPGALRFQPDAPTPARPRRTPPLGGPAR